MVRSRRGLPVADVVPCWSLQSWPLPGKLTSTSVRRWNSIVARAIGDHPWPSGWCTYRRHYQYVDRGCGALITPTALPAVTGQAAATTRAQQSKVGLMISVRCGPSRVRACRLGTIGSQSFRWSGVNRSSGHRCRPEAVVPLPRAGVVGARLILQRVGASSLDRSRPPGRANGRR